MADNEVAPTKTPSTPAEVLGALATAYTNVMGGPPPNKTSYLLPAAQSGVETSDWCQTQSGLGGPCMFDWNLGNITHVAGDGFDYNVRTSGNLKFRVYDSLQAGADDMMKWLKSHRVIPFADVGDLDGYVNQLAAGCYLGCVGSGNITQADYDNYKAGIASRISKLSGIVLNPPTPFAAKALQAAGVIGILGGVAYVAIPSFRRQLPLPNPKRRIPPEAVWAAGGVVGAVALYFLTRKSNLHTTPTCSSWTLWTGDTSSASPVGAEASRILAGYYAGQHKMGDVIVEPVNGIPNTTFRFLVTMHGPNPQNPNAHPGVSAFVCS